MQASAGNRGNTQAPSPRTPSEAFGVPLRPQKRGERKALTLLLQPREQTSKNRSPDQSRVASGQTDVTASRQTPGRKQAGAGPSPRRAVTLITHIRLTKPAFTCPTSDPERPHLLQRMLGRLPSCTFVGETPPRFWVK